VIITSLSNIGQAAGVSRNIKPNSSPVSFGENRRRGLDCIRRRHLEPVRMINANFFVTCSLSAWVQILRHGIGTNKVGQSSRHNDMADSDFFIPESILNNQEALSLYLDLLERINGVYKKLGKLGIPNEDRGYVLSRATEYSYYYQISIQALANLANKRYCSKAQTETRDVVKMMCSEVVLREPAYTELFVPNCEAYGRCFEEKPCKEKYRRVANASK